MCNCMTVCRVPDIETSGGRWPMPHHSPMCEDYKTEEFTVVEYDGTRCIMEPLEAKDFLAESDEEYTVYTVLLTRDQFECISEFQGF